MASPPSSDLSDPPSNESEHDDDDHLSTAGPSSRPSVDIAHPDTDHPRPTKRRRTGNTTKNPPSDLADSTAPAEPDWDTLSLSSDGLSSPPAPPHTTNGCSATKRRRNVSGATAPTAWRTITMNSGVLMRDGIECDKAFTRSDALAKHMRTVHEPELPRGAATGTTTDVPTLPSSKTSKSKSNKSTNGTSSLLAHLKPQPSLPPPPLISHDEFGQQIPSPSPATDNITYIPAHHPLTGQPGFMIHYPPDIHFSDWESGIPADQLMRLLRRQLHWAEREGRELEIENRNLEIERRDEWIDKEILMEGVMECEFARGVDGDAELMGERGRPLREALGRDRAPSFGIDWSPERPDCLEEGWRRSRNRFWREEAGLEEAREEALIFGRDPSTPDDDNEESGGSSAGAASPPPTGRSGGFEGEREPWDNYYEDQMAHFEALKAGKERERKVEADGRDGRQEAEMDAVGVLMGMSGGGGGGRG
ncbi:hypothetical protein LTR12_008933 [Friedmanniomyces endolithicus]|nr:hypothetical protein LTR12_008933 [Friedmanniomyces endolithicus]